MVPCPHCTGNYKNANSLRTHLSRAHGADADGARPRELAPARGHHPTRKLARRERAAEKKKPPREEHLSARDRRDLDVSTKAQAAYQLGYKAGAAKGLASDAAARAARERVALQRAEINALRSHLESTRGNATAQATLMSNIVRERDELVSEQMCLVCMDRQRSIAVVPCNHVPLCYECLLVMRNAAKTKRIKCPMCQATISGCIELSPGALPRAAAM